MYNYHTHTSYCDGKAMPEAFVHAAIERGMKILGFSAHAPVPFDNEWSLKNENVEAYFSAINKLKKQYAHSIEILNGIEADYIPGVSTPFAIQRKQWQLDYLIGSVHLVEKNKKLWFIDGPIENYTEGLKKVFDNNIKEGVTAYYKQINTMLLQEKPDIVGHLDKIKMHNKNRYFSTDEKWHKELVEETLQIIAAQDIIVELNTRGVYTGKSDTFFPDADILEKCLHKNIAVTLSTDAHAPDDLMKYHDEGRNLLLDIGFKHVTIISDKQRQKINLSTL